MDERGGPSATQTFDVSVGQNHAPRAVGFVPKQTLTVSGGEVHFDVAPYFIDTDSHDRMSYFATSSDSRVVGASINFASISGGTLRLRPSGNGTATVTVTARDYAGLEAEQVFEVMVGTENLPPYVVRDIQDLTMNQGEDYVLDLFPYFADPDGVFLEFEAASSRPNMVTIRVQGSNVTISVRWGRLPVATSAPALVTVVATDPDGLAAEQTFEVNVELDTPFSAEITECHVGGSRVTLAGTLRADESASDVSLDGRFQPEGTEIDSSGCLVRRTGPCSGPRLRRSRVRGSGTEIW